LPVTRSFVGWRKNTLNTPSASALSQKKRYLTDDEKLEEVRLKKLKLRTKDQMQMIEQGYRQGSVQVA